MPSLVTFKFSMPYSLEFSVPDPFFPTIFPHCLHVPLSAAANNAVPFLPPGPRLFSNVGSPVVMNRPQTSWKPLRNVPSTSLAGASGSVCSGPRSLPWKASGMENWYRQAALAARPAEAGT